MGLAEKTSVVGDVRRLLQDVVTPDIKAPAMEMSVFKERLALVEEQLRCMEAG